MNNIIQNGVGKKVVLENCIFTMYCKTKEKKKYMVYGGLGQQFLNYFLHRTEQINKISKYIVANDSQIFQRQRKELQKKEMEKARMNPVVLD